MVVLFTKTGDHVTGARRWVQFWVQGIWQARGTSRQRRPGSGRTYRETWDSGVVNAAVVSTRVAPETRGVDEVSLETKEKKGKRRALARVLEVAEVVRPDEA